MGLTKTIVIAEIGENHLGDMERAKTMIVEAARAGADMVKFQSYLASEVADNDPEKEWFAKVELSDEAHYELKACAEQHGIEFLSAPFSLNRAKLLCEELGLKKIKIASAVMLNFPLLDYINEHAETVFLSTGMSTIEEIKLALSHLSNVKTRYILHCVTQYPVQNADANLLAIRALEKEFPGFAVGYSDHTIRTLAPLVAVALGARVIEKHFTLDKSLPGTDHILSATPEELKDLVLDIRQVELLLGEEKKAPMDCEEEIKSFVRTRFVGR